MGTQSGQISEIEVLDPGACLPMGVRHLFLLVRPAASLLDDSDMKISIHPLGPELPIGRVGVDRALALRLRASFQVVSTAADAFADLFYERLFDAAPAVRSLFPAEMHQQKKKLLAMLTWVVDNLEKPEELRASVRELGRRHEGYGALAAHYPVVAAAMLGAIGDVSGTGWNPDIEADWRTALERICAIMLGGA